MDLLWRNVMDSIAEITLWSRLISLCSSELYKKSIAALCHPWAVKHWLEANIHSLYNNLGEDCVCGCMNVGCAVVTFSEWVCEWEPEGTRLEGELQPGLVHVWAPSDKSVTPGSFVISLPLFSLLPCVLIPPYICFISCESESQTKRKSSISTVTLMAKYRQASQPRRYVS